MNYKSTIALGLGCLSLGIFLPCFTHNAAARPIDRVQTNTVVPRKVTISGYLVGTDGTYTNIPCTALRVEIVEYGKRTGPLGIPDEKILAAGNGIDPGDSTCQYELSFNQPRLSAVFFKEKTYAVKVNGAGYLGNTIHKTKESFPDSLLLNVVVGQPSVPK
jgi:hypothetical protein